MLDMLSDEIFFCILANLSDKHLKIFGAASKRNRLVVDAADAYGLGVCLRALGEKGLALAPLVISKTEFIGVNFLRFRGMRHLCSQT